jgi:hypothetical protein
VRLCYTGQVKPLPGTVHGQSDPFAPTHWSVILAAGRSEAEPEVARAALAQLCQTYWAPLYSFVRSRGHAVHDAQDLTQSFFAYLIEHKIYMRADREKGKFRSFLLASLKNFLGHAYDREQTLKRGGSLDFLPPLDDARAKAAESLFQTHFVSAEPGWRRPGFREKLGRGAGRGGTGATGGGAESRGQREALREVKDFPRGECRSAADLRRPGCSSQFAGLHSSQPRQPVAGALPGIFARRGPSNRRHRRRGRGRVARVVSGTFKLRRR